MKAAKIGLAAFHCRKHVEHKARHGSHWHGSYRAAELKPYLMAASSFIKDRISEDAHIAAAVQALKGLLFGAGPAEIATRLRGLSASRKSAIALARLREGGVPPERLLAIHLAVAALIEEDPGSHRTREFRIVQTAKAAHRLASGYHRRWPLIDSQGRDHKIELHAYPRSSGRVMRFLGGSIEQACEWVVEKHLDAVLEHKIKHYGVHPAIDAYGKIQAEPAR